MTSTLDAPDEEQWPANTESETQYGPFPLRPELDDGAHERSVHPSIEAQDGEANNCSHECSCDDSLSEAELRRSFVSGMTHGLFQSLQCFLRQYIIIA